VNTPLVRLTHYDPRWRQEFQQTRSGLLQSCWGWVQQVEHVGSTAIPGMIARPTIDVMAVAMDIEGLSRASLLIEGLNYRQVDSPSWAADAVTLVKPRYIRPSDAGPTHMVFLTLQDSKSLNRALAIRETLRGDASMALRFEEAKVARWRSGRGELARYQADKAIFFAHLLDQLGVA